MEFEQSIISAILSNPRTLNQVDITSEHFEDKNLGFILDCIQELSMSAPVEFITLCEYMKNKTGQDWLRPITQAARSPAHPDNIKTYVEKVRSAAIQRNARRLVTEASLSDRVDIDSLVSELMNLNKSGKDYLKNGKQVIAEAFNQIDETINKGGIPGLSTGYASLDDKLGGWHKSDLVVIGARPAMGKTALLLSLQRACHGKSLMISAEMSSCQVGSRLLSQQSRVSASKIRRAQFEEYEWANLSNAVAALTQKQFWTFDKPGCSLHDIIKQSRMARHEHGVELILVDYLQKIKGTKQNRVDEVEEIAVGLKDLARELECPVVALAQVNRECEKRQDKRPVMSDLKGAGAIEQEADSIAFLYRDAVYNKSQDDPDESGIAELRWEKNRHGPTGVMNFWWDCTTMTFFDMDEAPQYYR